MGRRINDPTWAPDSLLTEAIQPDDSDITQQAISLLERVKGSLHQEFRVSTLLLSHEGR